jgi:hypothetical protein
LKAGVRTVTRFKRRRCAYTTVVGRTTVSLSNDSGIVVTAAQLMPNRI